MQNYWISVPKDFKVFYCNKEGIIIFEGLSLWKFLKSDFKIWMHKSKPIIEITSWRVSQIFSKSKHKIKAFQGWNLAQLKQSLMEVFISFSQSLKLEGMGYLFESINYKEKNSLFCFKLGFSHSIFCKLPLKIYSPSKSKVKLYLFGQSYSNIQQIAGLIWSCRAPEAYKGKGIWFEGEKILIKKSKKV